LKTYEVILVSIADCPSAFANNTHEMLITVSIRRISYQQIYMWKGFVMVHIIDNISGANTSQEELT